MKSKIMLSVTIIYLALAAIPVMATAQQPQLEEAVFYVS